MKLHSTRTLVLLSCMISWNILSAQEENGKARFLDDALQALEKAKQQYRKSGNSAAEREKLLENVREKADKAVE